MPCACDQCRRHAAVLGLGPQMLTRTVLRKAFLAAAKQWHPDRFERDPAQRDAAEERFKLIQAAYRELWEHVKRPVRPTHGAPPDAPPAGTAPKQPDLPHIFLGGMPGGYDAPNFPRAVGEIVAAHLQETERALAFLDLSTTPKRPGDLSQYLLLTSYRIFYRERMGIVSLLWYVDLGEISLTEPPPDRKPTLRQRIHARFSHLQRTSTLVIRRHTGAPFCTLTAEADDTAKKVVYNFLRQVKTR
ncbi:MAG TPA: DnaJ domain-containing protein [Terracidiphilus sp.]|nr:DnaJ domain-containing protein [Terracidiphilus sp.]